MKAALPYICSLCILIGAQLTAASWVAAASSNDRLRKLYQRGYDAYSAKKLDTAAKAFNALLPLLQKTQRDERKPGTRAWHMMTFGQFDVLYHLAQIAEQRNKPRRACRFYQLAQSKISTIPKTWTTWQVSPNIPVRIKQTQERLRTPCQTVPSLLTIKGLPPGATISRRSTKGQWESVKGPTLRLLKSQVSLKFAAPGYQSMERKNIPVRRWYVWTLRISLKKQPKPRERIVAVRRRLPPRQLPPPPVPVTRKWWFWAAVGVGVVAVGGAVTAVVIATQRPPSDTLRNPNGEGPITIW